MIPPIQPTNRMDRPLEARQDKRAQPLDATTAVTFSESLEHEKKKQQYKQYQENRRQRRAKKPYVPTYTGSGTKAQVHPHVDIRV